MTSHQEQVDSETPREDRKRKVDEKDRKTEKTFAKKRRHEDERTDSPIDEVQLTAARHETIRVLQTVEGSLSLFFWKDVFHLHVIVL